MPEMMHAFVMTKVGDTAVVEKPIPTPGPEEAVVKTTASLICTSDVHTVKGALPVPDGRTLGHESVGRRSTRSARRSPGFTEGQRVAVNAVTPVLPLQLLPARLHQPVRRRARRLQVHDQMDGNMAEYFVVPAAAGQPDADPRRPPRRAGRLHLRHALHRLHGRRARLPAVRRDRRGVRPGPGRACARRSAPTSWAPGRIIAVESRPERQALAKQFGADDIVDFTEGDPVEQIMDLTGGEGVDAAIEAFGFPQTFEALPAGDQGGRAGVEHRLPRREPEPAAAAARRVRPRHERQGHPHRAVPRRQRAHEPAASG